MSPLCHHIATALAAPRNAASTIRACCLATLAAAAVCLPASAQSPETCVAYMEADAIYDEAVRQLEEGCGVEQPKKAKTALEYFLCGADGPPSGKSMDEIEVARDRAYREAYGGPTSDIESVMAKLIRIDRIRCRKRFETVR